MRSKAVRTWLCFEAESAISQRKVITDKESDCHGGSVGFKTVAEEFFYLMAATRYLLCIKQSVCLRN